NSFVPRLNGLPDAIWVVQRLKVRGASIRMIKILRSQLGEQPMKIARRRQCHFQKEVVEHQSYRDVVAGRRKRKVLELFKTQGPEAAWTPWPQTEIKRGDTAHLV